MGNLANVYNYQEKNMHKEQVEYISGWEPLSVLISSNEVIEIVGQNLNRKERIIIFLRIEDKRLSKLQRTLHIDRWGPDHTKHTYF